MRIEMPYETEWIIKKIRERGYEAFAVGGCVRDVLLGRTPEDWDVTTSAMPEEVKAIFGKTVDTGLQHGTVTVIKNRKGYEVTTYRIDGEYHDGRHPDSVEFTRSLTEDLKRRDFTINAMTYSHETGIVDEFDGMTDLKNGIIRCVGCAHDRFTEDALRILRAIRFAAQLDFSIEDETYRAISDIAPNLAKVSKERIQVELTKLLLSDHPEKMAMVFETGIAAYVADGFADIFKRETQSGGDCCAEFTEKLGRIGALPREKSLRWAAFLRFLAPEQAVKILKGLKLDNETIGNVRAMLDVFGDPPKPEKASVRRVLSRTTESQFEGGLCLRELEDDDSVPHIRELWEQIRDAGDCLSLKELAVGGSDLIALGMKPGKEIGETLNALLELVLEKPELNDREKLLSAVMRGPADIR